MEEKSIARRCVIADDVRSSREMLKKWMREIGFEVVAAADGGQAWEQLGQSSFDLLITDLEMPDMSGLELIRRLRRDDNPRHKHLPVIIITSISDQQMSEMAQDFAVATVVFKPLDKVTMIDIAKKLMRGEPVQKVYESAQSGGGGVAGISPSLRNLIDQAK